MSDPAEGTEYWVSDSRVGAQVEDLTSSFILVARERRRVLVGARRDGAVELDLGNDGD